MARVYGVPKQAGRGGPAVSHIRVVGVQTALAKLKLVDKTARLQLGADIAGGAIHMRNAAQDNVHVVTGNLKSGIQMQKGPGPYNYFVTASSRDGDNPEKNTKEYAGYEEFGWSGLPGGHPYMRPAFEETRALMVVDLQFLAKKLKML